MAGTGHPRIRLPRDERDNTVWRGSGRAVAVQLVIAYPLCPNRGSGGYVGVVGGPHRARAWPTGVPATISTNLPVSTPSQP